MNAVYATLVKILFSAALRLAGEAAEEIQRLTKLAETELHDKTGAEKKAWLLKELKKSREWFRSRLLTMPSTLSSAIVDVLVAKTKVGT
jgi:hypothetical protein